MMSYSLVFIEVQNTSINRWVLVTDQQSPERFNTLFDRIKGGRVDIEWMKRREFKI